MEHTEETEKLKSHGDLLEGFWAERVGEVMPGYALIWAEYVGNDGGSNALPMRGCSAEAAKTREACWQCLYTIFESLALNWQCERDFPAMETIRNAEDYGKNLNAWRGFYANIGRIRDMLK